MASNVMRHIQLSSDRPPVSADLNEILRKQAKKSLLVIGTYAKNDETRFLSAKKREEVRLKQEKKNNAETGNEAANELTVGDRIAVLGSNEEIYSKQSVGFFEAVLMAYNHHCNLRTSPDDWWFCVIKKIDMAINDNGEKESVRKMFVNHAGKKELTVNVNEWPLSQVNYSSFFDKVSEKISENIKIPAYVDIVTADFSTTTAVQKIASQITLMSSLQHYFEYTMCCSCGIPAIEMLGTEGDWKKLISDLQALKVILQPIMGDLGLTEKWWSVTEDIFTKLLDTYHGKPDKEWWSHIIMHNAPFGSGFHERDDIPPDYSGWIVEFLEGKVGLKIHRFTSGLVNVPLKIVDGVKGVMDTAALVAGMAGFTVHKNTENGRPSVQPFQGWALMLPPNSPLTV
ncbi:uncharacterized protein LOC110252338 [Exaiptasia diaphana]|uniref:Uncharacterized protein n=1 Tax=Exaiptasia diaphana TaxID=2652724 RepID=A0A913Y4T8_EXADI|nr:uncharacterized protein LOC110252338 [Exaiptasia diaphana]KXJ28998.1 Uncharacterized protein L662 [Exaiptasia diaphana]